jgi:hypothetical protein
MTMTRARTRTTAVAFSALLAAVVALAPGPASAAPGDIIQVSPDGAVFTSEFRGLLDGTLLVPQDDSPDRFLVRNSSDEDAYLRVVLARVTTTDPVLRDAMSIGTSVGTVTGQAVALSAARPCAQLLTRVSLPAGQTIALRTTVHLGDLDGLEGQHASVSFTLQVAATADPVDSDACAAPPGGEPSPAPSQARTAPWDLATTGGLALLATTVTSVALICAGAALLLARRRRRTEP